MTGIVRGSWRLLTLVAMLGVVQIDSRFRRFSDLRERSLWRQMWCRRILHALCIPLEVTGNVPSTGLLVSNHLTYLDVLTFGAIFGGVFVSKQEVRSWPLIGSFTAAAGTIYVDRGNARSAAAANRRIAEALASDLPVLMFPEGTTSAGNCVLPFQSPLFEGAVRRGSAIWTASIHYCVAADAPQDALAVPYWGEMTFAPHLVRVLRIAGLRSHIAIDPEPVFAGNRRVAAELSQAAVARLYRRRDLAGHVAAAPPRGAVAPWLRETI